MRVLVQLVTPVAVALLVVATLTLRAVPLKPRVALILPASVVPGSFLRRHHDCQQCEMRKRTMILAGSNEEVNQNLQNEEVDYAF